MGQDAGDDFSGDVVAAEGGADLHALNKGTDRFEHLLGDEDAFAAGGVGGVGLGHAQHDLFRHGDAQGVLHELGVAQAGEGPDAGDELRTGITRFSVVPTLAQRAGLFTQAVFDPASSPRAQFPNNTIPLNRFDQIAGQILQHYPLPNVSGANNYVRTATEPDNQDQADFRLDRYFGEEYRIFGRYTFFRDDDNPVTPLPDGSGSLTSGVIGHAITRGDALAGDYDRVVSATALNQFRIGYSRRDLNQTSLQNGGITPAGPR